MKKSVFLFAMMLLPLLSTFGAEKIDGLFYRLYSNDMTACVVNGQYEGAVIIPSKVTYKGEEYTVDEIGTGAFSSCKKLTSVYIPGSVKNIGINAFAHCSGLISVTMEEGVEIIAPGAFYNCTGLDAITIPNSVTRICSEAFGGCIISSLTIGSGVVSIESQNNAPYSEGQLGGFSEIKTWGEGSQYVGNLPLKTIWLTNTPPSGYKYLQGEVNYVSNELYTDLDKQVVYPFLSSIFEVDGVKYVPISPSERTCDAFDCSYDESVKDISIDKTVSYKGISMSVRKICPFAFSNNPYIQTVHLGVSGIIGKFAFYGCRRLQGIDIPDDITDIGVNAFRMCTSLQYAKIGSGLKNLREHLFSNCKSLTDVQIGKNVSDLFCSVFEDCSALSLIRIPKNVMTIHQNVFKNCTGLKTLIFEDQDVPGFTKKTRSLEDWICTNSNEPHTYNFTVNAGDVLSFDYYGRTKTVGGGMVGSIKITINGRPIENEEPLLDNETGGDCGMSAMQAQQANDMKNYTFSYAQTFDTSRSVTMEVSGEAGMGIYNIKVGDAPNGVLHINNNTKQAYFHKSPLDSVYIGRKIYYPTFSTLGYSPFYRNTSLRSVKITDMETEVQLNEFYGCTGLKNVWIGDGVTRIDNWAFSDCSSLDYFEFGSSVKSIGVEAFSDCVKVTQIISHAKTPPTCGTQALDDINKWNCVLHVPQGSVSAYQAAPQWKEFFFIEAGIKEVKDDSRQSGCYYTLDGRQIEGKPTKKGLYITGGNKVMVQ